MQALHSGRNAVISRTLMPTNTLGARVRVSGWNAWAVYPWDHRLDSNGNHAAAVSKFLAQNGITGSFRGAYDGHDHCWVLVGD